MFKHLHMQFILGLDIGGTHLSGGLVDQVSGQLLKGSFTKFPVHSGGDSASIFNEWKRGILSILNGRKADLKGIGIAMPGPLDYQNGISYIKDLGKYDALYKMDLKQALREMLDLPPQLQICFQNDATCFALGERESQAAAAGKNILAVTLGTGLGSAFVQNKAPVKEGTGIPPGGTLYQVPYKNGIAEDTFSARGLLAEYRKRSQETVHTALDIYRCALKGDAVARNIFSDFGKELGAFLAPWLRSSRSDCLILGGNITGAAEFFLQDLKKALANSDLPVTIILSKENEKSIVLGAASLLISPGDGSDYCRTSNQYLLPVKKDQKNNNKYDVYPTFRLGSHKISEGINSIAAYIVDQKTVLIDGYAGVFWDKLASDLQAVLPEGLKINLVKTEAWLLPEENIADMLKPYLGEKDSIWGRRCDKDLSDFFAQNKIKNCAVDPAADINIVLGVGASLAGWDAPVIYIDLPKNELQYRMRSGCITNLGSPEKEDTVQMYKRFYFVDWVLLNKHKKDILNNIAIIADGQRPNTITWMYANDLLEALRVMSKNVFRARPWFEPGAWGGQWLKQHIEGINEKEINYAWSFELITPENGLLFESDRLLLEVSFDFLMFTHNQDILGAHNARRFKDQFPIRFDFLDTISGGNLSIQCHPSVDYIRKNFGEDITQDETYYILAAEDDAEVYLGFQENIDAVQFRKGLEQSNEKSVPINITEYVQRHPAKKHDFFLIPNGTVHSAAKGNLVLEISATPYIFTFKMYDWLRLDLNGNPRPINIHHAFNNLNFDRKGEKVKEELISKPCLLQSGKNWKQIHLPTHSEHFYDVYRYEFDDKVNIHTNGSCHVLMLVEGSGILIKTKNGFQQRFNYAETFVVPAAAESYTLINEGHEEVKVVKAFLKNNR